jgi:hypothetical protein
MPVDFTEGIHGSAKTAVTARLAQGSGDRGFGKHFLS